MRSRTLFGLLVITFLINLAPWIVVHHDRNDRKRSWIGLRERHVKLDTKHEAVEDPEAMSNIIPGLAARLVRPGRSSVLAQLLRVASYDGERDRKACDRLPRNVTVDRADPFLIGSIAEVVGDNESIAKLRAIANPNTSSSTARPPATNRSSYAYVMMVSNQKYIDGAMVVAHSLHEHSLYVQLGA